MVLIDKNSIVVFFYTSRIVKRNKFYSLFLYLIQLAVPHPAFWTCPLVFRAIPDSSFPNPILSALPMPSGPPLSGCPLPIRIGTLIFTTSNRWPARRCMCNRGYRWMSECSRATWGWLITKFFKQYLKWRIQWRYLKNQSYFP